jgi:ABC-type branched-subunit amino acid transport system ATPase component
MPDSGEDLLVIDHLTHRFGGLVAVNDCSWSLRKGVVTALIGPNGAGKTTVANVVSGGLKLQHGRVTMAGTDIGGWPPHRVAQAGLIRTFQISRDFERLTLLENLLVAAPDQPGESLLRAFFQGRVCADAEKRNLARAAELLDMFDLYHLRNEYASDISGGQKRLLEMARALMAEPTLLLLDEPMAGVSPVLIDRICEHLQAINERGVTLLLIEHNLAVVERICQSVTVMVEGKVAAIGTMAELRSHPVVLDAYLGREVSGLAAS